METTSLFRALRERLKVPMSLILGGAFSLAGFYVFFVQVLPGLQLASVSTTWESTNGFVESRGIINTTVAGQTQYVPRVNYTYFVNGKSYKGNRLDLGLTWSTNDRNVANSVVSKYEKGSAVEVFYDPNNPSQSTLQTGFSTSGGVLLFGTLLFIIVGLSMEFFVIRKMIRDRRAEKNESHSSYGVTFQKSGIGTEQRAPQQASNPIEIQTAAQRRENQKIKGKWYIIHDQKRYGPYSLMKIEEYVKDGRVNSHHICVSLDGQVQISVGELLKGRGFKAS